MNSIHIPAKWQISAHKILRKKSLRIFVISASYRGNSTYCNFLANQITTAGFIVAFVDAGQYSGVHTLPFTFERHLLYGFADRHNDCIGLTVVKKINYSQRMVTPVAKKDIKVRQAGDVYITPVGNERHHGLRQYE